MFDIVAIVLNLGFIIFFLFSLFTSGVSYFNESYIFIGYLIFTTLTLPNLISKVVFKAKIAGYTTALCFIYFPIQFLLTALISRITGLSLGELLPFNSIFNIILWNILFTIFILSDEKRGDYSENILRNIFYALIPAILFTTFVALFIRQIDSIVALDYLQHLTVANKMYYSDMICILPGQCSNLFLQHGYTTFYHIILGNISIFLGNNPEKAFYVLDIIFPLVASIPIFYLFKSFTKNIWWSQFGVLLTLLVFVMGGYDFIFFIPQTFALLLFIMILREKKLKITKLILASILLVLTHFIIGTFFVAYLWFKRIVIDNIDTKREVKIYYILLLVSFIFFLLANIAGFSVEKLLQEDAIAAIGSLTNAYYPNNIKIMWEVLGPVWIFVAIIFITNLLERRNLMSSTISISFLILGLIAYLLAPTYANKFAIGAGLFASIFIISFLSSIKLGIFFKTFVAVSLVLIFTSHFYIQYNRYLTFYTQENGRVSAVTQEDKAVIEYLNNERTYSMILSDPYTQLIVAAFTNSDTAHAQYMSLETREKLLNYLKDPNVSNYESLIIAPGMPKSGNFDVLYTSRIYRSMNNNDRGWIFNIYSLSINNSENIEEPDWNLIREMARTGRYPVYISDNFILFK
jgi:hypothetical protein